MIYGSVCSGIESASVAWEPLGMRPAWFAEIEKFPSAVLAHHWPQVPNLGDMTMIADLINCGMIPAPELPVGGTPCQAFSVAGKRASLDDDRGQLTLEYVRILNAIDEQREEPAAECPDGPRYKAIGNSKAVPVVRWVGQRILDRLAALRNTDAN